MKKISAIALVLALGACTLSPQQHQALMIGCQVDKAFVPLGTAIIGQVVPAAAPVLAVDQVLVHPLVLQACAALGGVPLAQ